jgi:hypothetical protein
MSRPRPAEGPTVSLFPFLAVLLCTMGSLLVLLVLFSRSAREGDRAAAEAAAAVARHHAEERGLLRDELAWRLEQLQAVRERTAADLARERLRLAGAEDDSRRLADELADLERVATALAADAAGDQAADKDRELAARLASTKESLDKARKEAAARPPAYAVVPYQGAHGTHRRPLYIECSLDGVYLQPEGIRLGPTDFEGPPGPGNPLASALRAAREHLATQTGDAGDPAAQPYPLLLVRPSGVMAYYAARESIQSWGSEFGYQFIDEEWTLQFPPADPRLAQAEQRAIDESRRRIAWLGESRRQRAVRPTQQFRAATTRGGVVAAGGPTVLGDQSRFDWTEEQAAQAGGAEPGRGFSPRDRAGAQRAESLATSGADVLNGRLGAAGQGDQGAGGGNTGGSGAGGSGGSGSGAGPQGAGSGYAGPSRFYAGASDGGARGAARRPGVGEPGNPESGGGDANTAGGQAGGAGGQAGAAGGPGGDAMTDAGGSGTGRSGSAAGQSAAAGGAASGGGSMQGPAGLGGAAGSTQAGGASGGAATMSLAGQRGSNWASLASAERPVPLRRPIRVACTAREMQVLDDGGRRVDTRIACPGATVFAVDPLVTAIHAKVAGWGIAGDRMYWKPELILSASAGGEGRREELERLLADSGLDTRRAESPQRVERLPSIERTGAVGLQR